MEAPPRQSRMTIDSLLNPSVDRHPDSFYPSPSSTSSFYYSPHYSSSPHRYSYPDPYYYNHRHYPSSAYYPENTRASFSSFSQGPITSSSSTSSSPSPYSRDRYDSVSSNSVSSNSSITTAPTTTSSTSSTNTTTSSAAAADRRRPPRPKYEEEEMYFIWYHRVDLCQEWKEVRESFNRQFPNRQRSGFQGIQCKFYRFIRDKKCPTLREQRRLRDGEFLGGSSPTHTQSPRQMSDMGPPKFGVVEWMGVWYPWMRENRDQVMMRRIST